MTTFRRLKRAIKGDGDASEIPALFEAMGFDLAWQRNALFVADHSDGGHRKAFLASNYGPGDEGVQGALIAGLCFAFGRLQEKRIEPFVRTLVSTAAPLILGTLRR